MKKAIITAVLLFAPMSAYASTYSLDSAHTSAMFKIRHMMISNVPGKFSGVEGTVNLNDQDISKSSVTASIDAKTINTDNTKRDEHLRSPDFFDVAKFPKFNFVSKSVKKNGEGLTVVGDLTIHGVTKPVTLEVSTLTPEMKDPMGGTRRGITAKTKINRKDFGLVWNKALESGGVVVGEDVDIEIDGELVKK